MSYAFSSNINSTSSIRGSCYMGYSEPDYYDESYDEIVEVSEGEQLCKSTFVFKSEITNSDIKNANNHIDAVGYQQAEADYLQWEADYHGVTVEKLIMILSGEESLELEAA